jgi:serine/threonine protein kinase
MTYDHGSFQPVALGRYLLLQKIGSGGMAEIYRAKVYADYGFEREYAIKKLLPNLADEQSFLDMFLDEGTLMAKLQHPNIVQVFDLGDVGRQFYISMECVAGRDLLALLGRCDQLGTPLPVDLALFIARSMLLGLGHAHRACGRSGEPLGVIHRDVTPCNVLLGYGGDVKLTDFGVAKSAGQRAKTDAGMLKGKVGYMSPEQINGDEIDKRSDLFSAGVILFEMLTMRRLFMGPSDLDVMLKIRDGKIEDDLQDLRSFDDELRQVVERALSHDPSERYSTAAEFHDDLLKYGYRRDLRVTPDDLGRFLRRVFPQEFARDRACRVGDPLDPTAFPNLASPKVARYRFREPNGVIVGPMSLDTMLSILKHRHGATGAAVSRDHAPWRPAMEFPELKVVALRVRRVRDGGISGSHHLGMSRGDSTALRPERFVEHLADFLSGVHVASTSDKSFEGTLDDTPFPKLLHGLWERGARGVLTVSVNEILKDIHLEDGAPGYVASNKPDELLGNFLCEAGVITSDQLQLALDRLAEFGGRLGDSLVREKMLPSAELFHYLSLQARQKLMEVFTWTGGEFSWQPGLSSGLEMYPLGIDLLEIIVQGVRSRMPIESVRAAMEDRGSSPMSVVTDRRLGLDGLNLTGRELAIVASIRDGTTPQSLIDQFTGSRAGEGDVVRVLCMLDSTGLLHFSGVAGHEPNIDEPSGRT